MHTVAIAVAGAVVGAFTATACIVVHERRQRADGVLRRKAW